MLLLTSISFSCQEKKQSTNTDVGTGEKSKEKLSVIIDYGPAPVIGRATYRASVVTKKFGFIIKMKLFAMLLTNY